MPDLTRSNVVSFGPFQLDLTAGELYRENHRIPLQEQPFQILKMLVHQPGEVLPREYIRVRLWPNGTIVEFDHSINTAIKKLRLALGDSAEEPFYVETLPRRGYRLMVPVERLETERGDPALKSIPPPEHEPPATSQTGKKVSHYRRVLEVLGGGGMGVVYAAEDIKLGRRVALKFLPQEVGNDVKIRERFEREARAASALNHRNICTIHEFGEHEGQPFIGMELLEGQTLRDRMTGAVPIEIDLLVDLAVQVTEGLEVAHRKSIIHRDIKPANIFITNRGEAKILDFGLAGPDAGTESASLPEKTESAANPNLTRTGLAIGTAAYMSPEQVRGERLDTRTDLFSFGLVLYEMATRSQAFSGDTLAVVHEAILRRIPAPARDLNPEVPLQLEKIINRALQKERDTRYQTASELRADLVGLKPDPQLSRRKARWSIVAACLLVLLSAASITVQFVKRQPASVSGLPQLNQRQLTINPAEDPIFGGEISPDGKYLAYSDGEGIHTKLLATGDVQTIPQPEAFKGKHVDWGVYWLPDSTRVLAGASVLGQRSSLWTVSVMGGVLTELRDDGGDQFAVSPDGSSLAFTTSPGRYFNREIWLMRPSGDNARRLFQTDENSGFWKIAWSPDGRRLAYIKYQEANNNVQVVIESRDLKGGRPTILLSIPPIKELRDFLWLPDGRMIYLFAEPDLNLYSCNYWVQRIDSRTGYPRSELRQLTNWAGFCMDDTSVTSDSKQLAFKRWWVQRSVQVADLESRPTRIATPTRLTRSEGNELPMAWSADSHAVLFVSNRTGQWGIFKQSLGGERAEPIVTGLENSVVATVSPDSIWILYVVYPKGDDSSAKPQLFRVPISGGKPDLILTAQIYGHRCAKFPAALCAIAEQTPDRKKIIFTEFDPLKGRGRELIGVGIDPKAAYIWDLSPDGTRIAVLKPGEGRIQILSLQGHARLEVTARGLRSLETLDWARGGDGFFCASRTQQDSVLLYVDLKGNTRTVWKREGTLGNESSGTSGIPSPDGRHLAMMGFALNANIWTVKGF